MANKKNKNNRTVKSTTVSSLPEKRKERHEFMKNQPVLYIIFAIAAFIIGNYLFDLVAQFF